MLALFRERRRDPCCGRSVPPRARGEELARDGVDETQADRIRELIDLVQDSGIGEVTIEEGETRVTVRRGERREMPPRRRRYRSPPAHDEKTTPRESPARPGPRLESPMAGSSTAALPPDAPPFVDVGDNGGGGPDALSARSDEALQRGEGRGRTPSSGRSTSRTRSRSSTASCCSSSSRYVGSAAVIGDEAAGWASGEGVEEHADGEREQSLGDPLHEPGGCLCEVLLEPHLALEVGDRRLDHEAQAGKALLAGEVVGGAHAVGSEDRIALQRERLARTRGPTSPCRRSACSRHARS